MIRKYLLIILQEDMNENGQIIGNILDIIYPSQECKCVGMKYLHVKELSQLLKIDEKLDTIARTSFLLILLVNK